MKPIPEAFIRLVLNSSHCAAPARTFATRRATNRTNAPPQRGNAAPLALCHQVALSVVDETGQLALWVEIDVQNGPGHAAVGPCFGPVVLQVPPAGFAEQLAYLVL